MAVCTYLISKEIQPDCSSPIFEGLETIGYIINKDDIKSVTEASGVVSALSLKTGTKAFTIQQLGKQPFNGTGTEIAEGDYMNRFNRKVAFVILDNSPDISEKIVTPMANGEFVVIVENKYKDASKKNAFEIYGLDKGARASAISQTKYENMAGWSVELTEENTPNSGKFFWDTDYDTSKADLEALLVVQ